MSGTADATTAPLPHGKDANFTARLDNNAPDTTDATNLYAAGLRERMEAAHTIVLTSEAFQFDSCSASQVRAFGLDRGNDDPGTETDESLLSAYKSITFEEHQITVQFYEESTIAGETVSVAPEDQVVARGDNCIQTPSEPGWYQIDGKLNGSTNGDTTADFSQSTTSHYIYVCDCSSRAEAEQTLGPPPGQGDDSGDDDSGGSSTPTATATTTATATPTPESEDGGGTATATPTSTVTTTTTADATATATATAEATSSPASGGSDGPDSGDDSTTTATAGSVDASDATTTATRSGQPRQGGGDGAPQTPTIGTGPGFGVVAALVGALLAGLLALRRD